ncbi:tRNA (adenosine(37)-N6)-dimethylallyltransferase MiaA [bacterium]|nr:tRNA (adenosine(37)-N6)-dimethylallyltransferase MiaA [bacterium]
MGENNQHILVLIGPTAIGKTSLALRLAPLLNAEIISADSRQIYKYLDIGTAKPPPDPAVPHHLVDFLEPTERFNAMRFAELARARIERLFAEKKVPMVVGGTGLYIKSLIQGIFKGAGANPKVRTELIARHSAGQDLYKELRSIDPRAAEKIHPHNYVRIQRALEVYYSTGKTLSNHWDEAEYFSPGFRTMIFGLTLTPRSELYRKAEERVDQMIRAGWAEEVRKLLARGYSPGCPAFEALGYREIVRYLQNQLNLEEVAQLIKTQTRNYIKRQYTFFKKMDVRAWYNLKEIDEEQIAFNINALFPRQTLRNNYYREDD